MGYDIAIIICLIFAVLTIFVGFYATYKVVFSVTESWFEDSNLLRWIFNIVCYPIALVFVFFFLSYPIMIAAGAAIQLSFHGH